MYPIDHSRCTYTLLSSVLFAFTLFMSISAVFAQPTQFKGEVISSDQFVRKQVGGGKAVIEIFKEGKNAFLARLTLAPHGTVPQHRDPTEEYLIIEAGGGEITLDGVKRQVKAGDVIYMPAGAEVSFKNGPKTLVALQVFAGPESARKYDKWAPVVQPSSKR